MGPCLSIASDVLGVNMTAPPEKGPHEMYSEGSFAIVNSKATWSTNGGSKPYTDSIDLRGGSHTLAKAWKLECDAANPASFNTLRYTDTHDCTVSKDAMILDGSTPDISANHFGVWYCQAHGLSMPVSWTDGENGNRMSINPQVYAVDVYISVDGKEYTDGHVCYGSDPNLSRDKIIAQAVKDATYGEYFAKDLLSKGPSDGSKPWATIYRDERWGPDDSYIYLPFIADDVDNELGIDHDNKYIHCLLTKFSQLLGKVGSGAHTFTLRLRPRGVIFEDDDYQHYESGGGSGNVDSEDTKNAVRALGVVGQHLTAANAPGMSATFTLNIDKSQASGKGPVRKAQPFAGNWPAGEIEECIELAMGFANSGVCGAKAAQMAPGSKCCHIILSEGDQGVGIKTARYGKERSYDFFCAWALFKSKDGKPDSLGAQIKFVVKRDLIVNYRPVDADWRSAGFETAVVGQEQATGLTITNAEIDAAIKRDAEYYS